MKAFVIGMAAMGVIGIGAWFLLTQEMDFSSAAVHQSDNGSVRLSPNMGGQPGAG